MKLSVLIPIYNERSTLAEIVRRVEAVPIDKEIIIVDNVSTDGTREELESWQESGRAGDEASDARLRVVFQTVNRGKGASVRRALSLARAEWVIIQDADLEYDPADYLKLFARAEGTRPDGRPRRKLHAVFGTRLVPGSATRANQPRTAFYYGRVGFSLFFRLLYAAPFADVATCYKLMQRNFANSLDLKSDGFNLDFELSAKIALAWKRGARIAEIPISYAPRTELEGKKIRALHDGWRAMVALVRFRFLQ